MGVYPHPWLYIDFVGPFQRQNFILIDSYTKLLKVIPVSAMTSRDVVRALRRIFTTHGLLDTIMFNNGMSFTSVLFREFIERYSICHIKLVPLHPANNRQAEHMVRTTKETFTRLIHGNWDYQLGLLLLVTVPDNPSGLVEPRQNL